MGAKTDRLILQSRIEVNGDSHFALSDPQGPVAALGVGDALSVRVNYYAQHLFIRFDLCSESSCSSVHVTKLAEGGEMRYSAYLACNEQGDKTCILHHDVSASESKPCVCGCNKAGSNAVGLREKAVSTFRPYPPLM